VDDSRHKGKRPLELGTKDLLAVDFKTQEEEKN
jgi:hypothetical protein